MAEDKRMQIVVDLREMKISLPESGRESVDLTGICSASIGTDSKKGRSGTNFLEIKYVGNMVDDLKLEEYTSKIKALLEETNVDCGHNRACPNASPPTLPRHFLRYKFNECGVTIRD